ncbi:MAG: hypothetical protein VX703_02725 [Candidatus Neomarinimicrobiota bacterium]|nr:hypothetical protein [Candidatus Neomarinimicrobiota bacterium]MEC9455693.1 hypothetical protein [Candidatus Neomarinimicrobiota bacterium]MED5451372.1 hypothetical protein [Candidatus Neomarinimicrobiota bacterium]
MLYFIVHNHTLVVFKRNLEKDKLILQSKVKFHHSLLSTIYDPKLLSNVIAQSLDELNEKIVLENQEASIVINDELLSHSLVISSAKDDIKLAEKIKNELQTKWKDLFNNYFYIAESRKSSKKFIHVVEINHYLKEKIKLNFNNSGIDIKGLIPLSSVILAQAKTTQYRVVKSLKNYFIFNYSRKGFSFFKANYSGKKKTFNKVVGLNDLQKIAEGTLKKSNSKYLLFSDLDIVKTLSQLIDISSPMLNFINPVGIQIIDDSIYKRKRTFTKQKKETNFFNYFRNIVAAFLTLILLVFSLWSINKTDLKSLNTEVVSDMIEEPVITDVIVKENPFEFYNAKSYSMINVFDSIVTEYGNSISMLSIVDGVVSAEGNEDLLSLLNGVDPNAVKQIDLSKNKVVYKIDPYLPTDLSKNSTSISNFLNWILDIEEIEFKIIDGVLLDREVGNIILRIEGLELSNEIIDQITNYNNFIMRKILFTKADNSIHFYITVLS